MFNSKQLVSELIVKNLAKERENEMCDNCRHVGYHLRKLDNLLMRNTMAKARSMNLDEVTVMHGWILAYIDENKEKEIYQKDIETQFGINRSTVTNIVKLMEKKELIRREPVPRDARLKKLVLTEKGILAREKSHETIQAIEKQIVLGISEEELDVFFHLIEKIRKNLEQKEE
ncbi:MAG: MarR family winged helix-turn-helix transcriptional regulator [Lachnospiraceae bacterium]